MKRSFIIVVLFLGFVTASGQPSDGPRERVYVQTDKETYLSGELVWLKFLTTDDRGIPLEFSRVGYVELLDESGSRAQASLQVDGGIGQGAMVLPTDLTTGAYRLIGYTRYMRNEPEEVFFEKIIGVINPLDPQITVSEEEERGRFPAGSSPVPAAARGLTLAVNRHQFAPRELVEVAVRDIPSDIHSLSVVVTGVDLDGSLPTGSITHWLSAIPAGKALSGELAAEYEGHIVHGQLTGGSSDGNSYGSDIFPVIAFQGDEPRVFISQADGDGKASFVTRRANGYGEVVTSVTGRNPQGLQVELLSPFVAEHTSRQLPLLDLERIDPRLLAERSVGMQVQYAYVADSLTFFRFTEPELYEKPFWRYYTDEYAKFGTMGELVVEYVSFARFRTVDGKRRLGLVRTDTGLQNNSLVLLDGIPVFDHDLIYNYNPLLIHRIDIYNGHYVFGGLRYEGIIALYTEQNNAAELSPDPYTRIVTYEMPQAPRYFYAPDHSVRDEDRLPDFRHTLYWNADLGTDNRTEVTIPFFTSDLKGDFRIWIEGLTSTGEPVWAWEDISVR